MADAVDTVATKFPNTKFAVIDVDQSTLKHKPANVQGLLFAEQQSGYLAGYLAGLYTKDKGGKQVIGSVGGQKIPPVDHYIAGYQAGAKAADPGITTLNGYSQDFVAQDKCKEIALNQIAKGAGVVFQVAGQCGLGALDAAKEKGKQGIGVDADQGYLGPYILSSAEKKVDVAVFNAIKAAQAGQFQGGQDVINQLSNNGVGFGTLNAVGQKYKAQIDKVKQDIIDGKIKNIPDTVK
jgi:basic membrane protein A